MVTSMPTISESTLALRFLGDDLDPSEISTKLGVTPTIGLAKGERYQTPNGTERASRTGMWHRATAWCRPADLDQQIAEVLAGTSQDMAVWNALCSRYNAEVYCGLRLQEGNEGFDISPASMRLLGERGLRLGFDVYAAATE